MRVYTPYTLETEKYSLIYAPGFIFAAPILRPRGDVPDGVMAKEVLETRSVCCSVAQARWSQSPQAGFLLKHDCI